MLFHSLMLTAAGATQRPPQGEEGEEEDNPVQNDGSNDPTGSGAEVASSSSSTVGLIRHAPAREQRRRGIYIYTYIIYIP
jgi:hypothetical protein